MGRFYFETVFDSSWCKAGWSSIALTVCYLAYINSIICKLEALRLGAYVGQNYVGCLVYADDILLASHSISTMQTMLDVCMMEARVLDLQFNAKKSVALRIGARWQCKCAPMTLKNAELSYVNETKYLGVVLSAGRSC